MPPWANLPPVRPPRRGAGSGAAPRHDPDAYRNAPPRRDAPARPAQDSFRDGRSRPDQAPWRDQQPFPGQASPRREPAAPYEPAGPYEPASPYDSGPRPATSYLGSHAGQAIPGSAAAPGSPTPPGGYRNSGSYQPSDPGYGADPDGYDAGEPAAFVPSDDEAPSGPSRVLGARASRALLRKRRRSLVMLGAAVVVIATVVSVLLMNQGGGQAANISSDFITTFQPGELRSVPNACDVVPAATVQQYLPGQVTKAAPQPIDGNLGSACNWTLDHQPTYRLLEVSMLAYAPNGLASGNGSATSAATDAYTQQYQELQAPPKGGVSGQATVSALPGIGNAAFSAMQVFHVGGAVSDTATVVIRFHNVIVQAELSGLQHSNKGHYGPVSQSQLAQGALAFAQAAYAALR